jgi:hypothetical protein
MAADRDPAGAPGPGLSGGRGEEGLRAGTPGSSPMGDREAAGTAEVRSGLHSGAPGEPYSGLGFAGAETMGEPASRERGTREDEAGRTDNFAGRARHVAEDLGHRASDAASAARERVSGLRDRTNRVLERRGVVERLRENPLPVLGVAFAIGFLLAGGDDRNSNTRTARARRELRSALVAGLSAGIAQGARSFLNEAGSEGSGFLSSLIDNLAGESGGRGSEGGGGFEGSRAGTGGAPYARGGASRRESF